MSQKQRIVELLRTGPKTCAEILQHVPCIVHSRVSGLRDDGYVIAHETTGPGASGSLYTLLSEPDRAETVVGPDGTAGSLSGVGEPAVTSSAMTSGEGDGGHFTPSPPSPDSCVAQLSLIEAA